MKLERGKKQTRADPKQERLEKTPKLGRLKKRPEASAGAAGRKGKTRVFECGL